MSRSRRTAAHAPAPATGRDDARILDLRSLVASEPLERARAAADRLEPGGRLDVLTPLMPFPLIELLGARGLVIAAECGPNGTARLAIHRPA